MSSALSTRGPVVVVGTCNLDFALHVGHLPKEGETVLGDLYRSCGGKAANQAVAAARLGADVSLVTRVAEDENGRTLLEGLRKQDVRVDYVTVVAEGESGIALIMVDPAGRTTIGVAEGVNRHMSPADLADCRPLQRSDAVVIAEMGVPMEVIEELCALKRRVGFTFIFNPAPVVGPLSPECCGAIDVITPNASEAAFLTGITVDEEESALQAARALLAMGVRTSVVTLGERGLVFATADDEGVLPAFSVDAVDATAASDAFNAGIAVSLQAGAALESALRYGMAVAAICVTRDGAQPSLPTAAEVRGFLAEREPSLIVHDS
jgi:ribokinase